MPCTQTHMPTCMPIHSRTRHMFTCPLYAHMRTHIHMPTCMPIHSHMRHAFTCPLYTHMCTHIHMHTRLHTHSFTAPALGPGALTLPSQGLAISSSCGGRQFEMEPGSARWHTPPTTHASEPPEPACSGRSCPAFSIRSSGGAQTQRAGAHGNSRSAGPDPRPCQSLLLPHQVCLPRPRLPLESWLTFPHTRVPT